MLFVMLYVLSFFIVFEFDNWFMIWLGLEVNMLSFLLMMFKHKNMKNLEACFKYFFVQSIGSGMLMFTWFLNGNWVYEISGLIVSYKLGAGPFFYWFPSVVDGLGWIFIFLMLSMQKVLPLLVMSMMFSEVLWMIMLLSMIVGCFGMFNQSKLKLIMAYSSIHHLGWMMLVMFLKLEYWWIYLIMYSILIFPLIFLFYKMEMLMVSEVGMSKFMDVIILGIMSLSGLPPFLGFFLKMWVFGYLLDFSNYLFIFMIMMSVVMCYVYMRMVYMILMWKMDNMFFLFNIKESGMYMNLLGYVVGAIFGFYILIM